MTTFARSFDFEALGQWIDGKSGTAVHALFARWALPGEPSSSTSMLRVCVRNGYLNFYAKGQSVAKLSLIGGAPRVEVHEAYLAAVKASGANDDGAPKGQTYKKFDAAQLETRAAAAFVPCWIAAAESYAGAEKRFVDDLVGSNCNVIDLEMALPADIAGIGKVKSAPRMDLVVAQSATTGAPQIAFWEAKCSINSELRAVAEYQELDGDWVAGPKVIHQLRKYQAWIETGAGLSDVQTAYLATTTALIGLANIFGKPQGEAFKVWERLAACNLPEVVLPPAVAIGNYCPLGHEPKSGDKGLFESRAVSFSLPKKSHKQVLERHGIYVHEVGNGHNSLMLPVLTAGSVTI